MCMTEKTIAKRLDAYRAAEIAAKQATEAKEAARAALLEAIGEENYTGSKFEIKYTRSIRETLDGAALREALPEIAARFLKKTETARLSYKYL